MSWPGQPDMSDPKSWPGGGSSVFAGPFMPALALAFSSGLKTFGAISRGNALVDSAKRRQQAAEYEAQQLKVNAGQAIAASQRDAYFKGLEGDRVISAIRARAAASGGGVTNPTVMGLVGDALAQRAYNMQASLYGGEEKARVMEMQAESKRYDAALGVEDAKQGRKAYMLSAAGSVAEGASSLFQKYWAKDKVGDFSGAGAGFGDMTPGRGYDLEFTP